eukprot:scaffold800_cov197-Alexandrium_tamarense.AAC.22
MQQHNDFDRIAEQQFTAGDTLALVERVCFLCNLSSNRWNSSEKLFFATPSQRYNTPCNDAKTKVKQTISIRWYISAIHPWNWSMLLRKALVDKS